MHYVFFFNLKWYIYLFAISNQFQAYKVGLFGRKIVWIMYGFFSKTFWEISLEQIDCTADQMRQVAEGIFLIKHANNNMDQKVGISNITCEEKYL